MRAGELWTFSNVSDTIVLFVYKCLLISKHVSIILDTPKHEILTWGQTSNKLTPDLETLTVARALYGRTTVKVFDLDRYSYCLYTFQMLETPTKKISTKNYYEKQFLHAKDTTVTVLISTHTSMKQNKKTHTHKIQLNKKQIKQNTKFNKTKNIKFNKTKKTQYFFNKTQIKLKIKKT